MCSQELGGIESTDLAQDRLKSPASQRLFSRSHKRDKARIASCRVDLQSRLTHCTEMILLIAMVLLMEHKLKEYFETESS